ncbi:ornithine carbamoyltransferase [Candidatus Woesearchaeota archaeon]|nr:ornithine carbamoyltransferase [Candidatus Woesearchaeota archaeon]
MGIIMLSTKDFLSIADLSSHELSDLISFSVRIKRKPRRYRRALAGKNLLTLFAKPSLRTRLSFEVGMQQLGGHAIYYSIEESTLGHKETISDFANTASRYVDAIMARLYSHKELLSLAKHSSVPVINGLTDFSHPCQALADAVTMLERKKKLAGLKLAYFGDGKNNTCHSLLEACAKLGIHMTIAAPKHHEFQPDHTVLDTAKTEALRNHCMINVTTDAHSAAANADVLYTDAWMSYHVSTREHARRRKALKHYQVNEELLSLAAKDAIFMHCLPAKRGEEVTSEVIDGPQSAVFDQAENRLHAQKALLIRLLKEG